MSTKVCVNCGNLNPVNGTDNRLVTESCGHVKCMHCLLHEKSGCAACIHLADNKNTEETLTPSIEIRIDTDIASIETPELLKEVVKGRQAEELKDEMKKRKLDISHIRVEPEGSQHKYTCTICGAKFNARNHVVYHAYCNKKQKKPYQCPEPECLNHEGFSTNSHFWYHMQVHKNEKDHVCDVCGESFICKSKLKRHILKHTNEKMHACSICKKAFNNKSALRKHNLTHTGERPYCCQTCGMRFRDSSNYKKHLAKHSERAEKKCSCGVCGVSLACRRSSGAGGRTRQHVCPRAACHMAFHTSKDLRRHMLVHTDSKSKVCGECGRQFRRKDNLRRHVRNTHSRGDSPAPAPASEHQLQNGTPTPEEPAKKEIKEKAILEVLNPLPPLPAEVIQKLYTGDKEERNDTVDKSYIIKANHARESVIVSKYLDRKIPSPETEYVHKIRRANLTNKEITLPPIDEMKFLKVFNADKRDLDVGPLPKNIQTYKSILHDKSEMHWKKRLADNE